MYITKNIYYLGLCDQGKNRYAEEDLMKLGETCDPTGVEADWSGIALCVKSDTTVTDYFGTFTNAEVPNDIKTDGLVVRIDGTVIDNAKTNLAGEICKALKVRNIVKMFNEF